MKQKTLLWAVLFGLLALLAAGFYLLYPAEGVGHTAVIYVDGEVYDTVDLAAVAVPYEFTVKTEYGYNTVRVSPGAIEVAEADCSEQVCVNQGTITDGFIPITCLPHHMVIRIEEPEA